MGPGMDISGLEDEFRLSDGMPRLLYLKSPAADCCGGRLGGEWAQHPPTTDRREVGGYIRPLSGRTETAETASLIVVAHLRRASTPGGRRLAARAGAVTM